MSDQETFDDPYAGIASLYDLEHDEFTDDIALYLQCITAVGDPVLELGCGSGRVLQAIARAGSRITGLDRSQAMLDRVAGRMMRPSDRARITLHVGEMTDAIAAPGGPFGIALLSLNALLHLETQEDQLRTLGAVLEAMDPRGQVLIDVMNPTIETLRGLDGGVVHEGTWLTATGDMVDKFSTRRVSTSDQLIHTRIWYDIVDEDQSLRRVATSFNLRYVTRGELELMLRLAGYAEWRLYGSYDLDPFEETSDRLIVAAEITA